MRPYVMDLRKYYGQNTLYRILRPLAISALIEQQVAYADFAVDPSALRILRFRRAASLAWSGDVVVLDHPAVNWHSQEEHVVSDRLDGIAAALVKEAQPGTERVLSFREFEAALGNREFFDRLAPFPNLFFEFDPSKKPVLWLRFVCFGQICNEFILSDGRELGFEERVFPVRQLLQKSKDQHIERCLDKYERAIRDVVETKL